MTWQRRAPPSAVQLAAPLQLARGWISPWCCRGCAATW